MTEREEAALLGLQANGLNPLKLLAYAMTLARPFVKMSGEQGAAWDVVNALATGAGAPGPGVG